MKEITRTDIVADLWANNVNFYLYLKRHISIGELIERLSDSLVKKLITE